MSLIAVTDPATVRDVDLDAVDDELDSDGEVAVDLYELLYGAGGCDWVLKILAEEDPRRRQRRRGRRTLLVLGHSRERRDSGLRLAAGAAPV